MKHHRQQQSPARNPTSIGSSDLGNANVDKVKMEFGINMGGEAGVPYVTKGTAECSLKITVECSFPKTP